MLELRKRFQLEPMKDTERTCIIVARIPGEEHEITLGLIVDEVSEVQEVTSAQLAPAPAFETQSEGALFNGMAKMEDRVVILLNIQAILSQSALRALHDEITVA